MNNLSIRDRVPADLQSCISVLADVHRLDRYPLNWPANPYWWLSPDNTRHAWVAERGSTVVGHVAVHHTATAAAWINPEGQPVRLRRYTLRETPGRGVGPGRSGPRRGRGPADRAAGR